MWDFYTWRATHITIPVCLSTLQIIFGNPFLLWLSHLTLKIILSMSSSKPKVYLTFHFPRRRDRRNTGNSHLQTCAFSCFAAFPLHTVRDLWQGMKMCPIPLGTEGDAIPSSLVPHRHLLQHHSLCSPASLFTACSSGKPPVATFTFWLSESFSFCLVYLSRYRLACGFFSSCKNKSSKSVFFKHLSKDFFPLLT